MFATEFDILLLLRRTLPLRGSPRYTAVSSVAVRIFTGVLDGGKKNDVFPSSKHHLRNTARCKSTNFKRIRPSITRRVPLTPRDRFQRYDELLYGSEQGQVRANQAVAFKLFLKFL